MVYSMTGYATATRTLARCVLSVELRSVNSRYLDITFRLPEELRAAESQLRELIGTKVNRGKLECRASLVYLPAAQGLLDLNEDLVRRLAAAGQRVRKLAPDARALQVADILRWPGVIGEPDVSVDELGTVGRDLIEQVLADFNAARAREGAKLVQVILERAVRMQTLVQQVAPKVPALVKAYGEKLSARLLEASLDPNDDRMRQEIVLFASKIDVDEELSRLAAHIKELEHVLTRGGAVGRRLDFLMQEFNREANTLGSKSADLESTQVAVELKVLIEQMREQVQNIE
ncbi:MAG: YicC family protein [Burkholderiales bacterium]|nr:YicC family protein [Burkholderiales bacterium]